MTDREQQLASEFVTRLMHDAQGPNTGSLETDIEAWPRSGIETEELVERLANAFRAYADNDARDLSLVDFILEQAAIAHCGWCSGRAPGAFGEPSEAHVLDEDGCKSELSGRPGQWAHAYEDSWWPCDAAHIRTLVASTLLAKWKGKG